MKLDKQLFVSLKKKNVELEYHTKISLAIVFLVTKNEHTEIILFAFMMHKIQKPKNYSHLNITAKRNYVIYA